MLCFVALASLELVFIDQSGIRFRDSSASVSQVLELKVCAKAPLRVRILILNVVCYIVEVVEYNIVVFLDYSW